ncbi:MAG: Kelch repeat-containing protein, partial [Deltaproteobacteria bacterium]
DGGRAVKRLLLSTLLAAGCFRAAGAGDLYPCDAGLCYADGGAVAAPEAGAADAGSDAGPADAGSPDAGLADAGFDGGPADAGPPDSGCTEARCAEGTHCFLGSCQPPASMPGGGRSQMAGAVGSDGLIYVFGGSDSSTPNLARVEAYNPETNVWYSLPDMAVARQSPAAALGGDGRIYVMGGYSNLAPNGAVTAVEALSVASNPVQGSFSLLDAGMLVPRERFVAGPLTGGGSNEIFVAGGYDSATSSYPQSVEALLLGSAPSWTGEPAILPTPRDGTCGAVDSVNRLYVFGGSYNGAPSTEMDILDLSSPSSFAQTSMPFGINGGMAARDPAGERLYIVGGGQALPDGGTAPGTSWGYAVSGSVWTPFPGIAGGLGAGVAAISPLAPDLLFAIGGSGPPSPFLATVMAYSFQGNHW